ncbi:uncharacterized protein LOC129607268 [Condylostylus longicornis]|uniref:uncharacterized protein LOC129607268 n=1 Tax=Condylostylus longicornis TaxID=2530218 RepID=UPI00244DB613|nr:uncharacterized protein LOC129607268 [Condylostylus longicornis]
MKSNFYLERLGIRYSVRLNEGVNIVGRVPNATVKISGPFGSRNHCSVMVDGENIRLEDFSSNGTFVNEIEYKGSSTVIRENDKIGIGVHSIDEFLQDCIYHVYRLKKIRMETFAVEDVAEKDDDDSVVVISEDESIEPDTIEDKKNTSVEKNSEGQSNIVFVKPKKISIKNIEEPSNSSKQAYINQIDIVSNKNSENDKIVSTARLNQNRKIDNSREVSKTLSNNICCFSGKTTHNGVSRKVVEKMEIVEKPNELQSGGLISDKQTSDEGKEADCNFLEFQSDELSQAVWDEIKQEIAELDITEIEGNENLQNIDNNFYTKDVLDLTLDDDALKNEMDEELDPTTRKWFMKLSQNFDETYEKKSNSTLLKIASDEDEIISNGETMINQTSEGFSMQNDKNQNRTSMETNRIEKNDDSNFVKVDVGPAEINKKKNNVPIIDAPSLPLKRGKNRGVSADLISLTTTKKAVHIITSPLNKESPKKSLRTHYSRTDNQSLKLQKKWLEKPNAIREKNKKIQIRDKRKEKLKELAEKKKSEDNLEKPREKRKHSISIDNLDDEEKEKVVKKAKVKVTDKNRGSFLTDLASTSTSKILNRRKSSEPSTSKETLFSNVLSSADRNLRKSVDINNQNRNKKTRSMNRINTAPNTHHSARLENNHKSNVQLKKNLKSCIKSNDKKHLKNSPNRKVKFNLEPTVYTFYVDTTTEENVDQISVKETNKRMLDLSHFENRKRMWQLKYPRSAVSNTDHILSEILSWKPEWFDVREKANVNGTSLLCPMIHSFKTLEDYQKIVFPLMKLELWERLLKDRKSHETKTIQLNLVKFEIIEQTSVKRIICHCEYTSALPFNKPLFYSNELVFVEVLNKENIFGHVITNRVLNPNSTTVLKTYGVKIESNYNSNFLTEIRNAKVIKVQKLSVIATELGAFEAVKNLAYSPLLQKILSPQTLMQNTDIHTQSELKLYKYNGYDQLNDSQKNILMETYLRTIDPSRDTVTLIEGPPGTGKSRLITNLILQLQYGLELRHLDRKILVCAQSNVAVDVITQKLIRIRKKMDSKKFRLVRYGVLDKMHMEVRPYSLTELIKLQRRSIKQTPKMTALMDEKQLLEEKVKRLENRRRSNSRDDNDLEKAKKDLSQINNLLSESYNEIDRNLEYKFLANANIVCTTLSSCVRLLRYCNYFDVCIIDEATQCNEPWTLVPLQFGINSLILIGDTQQLPATTLSYLSKAYNFGKSYFTRAKEVIGMENRFIMSLKIQYRMHPEICKWPNSYFYRNRLMNDDITTSFTPILKPYTIIELNFNQNKSSTNGIENCSEADFIVKLVQGLVELMPVQKFSYGIITPYNLHCHNLREKIRKEKLDIEVNTIDSYQGKEKDVIIISNARTQGIGFLNEICRLNVALTRAKKCLILCGNFQHLSDINVWKSLISDAKKRKLYYEPDQSDIKNFNNKILKYLKL